MEFLSGSSFVWTPASVWQPSLMANLERNNKILFDLTRQPGNNVCADCGAPGKCPQKYFLALNVLFLALTVLVGGDGAILVFLFSPVSKSVGAEENTCSKQNFSLLNRIPEVAGTDPTTCFWSQIQSGRPTHSASLCAWTAQGFIVIFPRSAESNPSAWITGKSL